MKGVRDAVEHAPDHGRYVSVTDADHRWVAVSEDLAALLGYRPAELVGRPAEDVVDAGDADRVAAYKELLAEAGELDGVLNLRTKSGRLLPMAYVQRTVQDGPLGTLYVSTGSPLELEPADDDPLAFAPPFVSYAAAGRIADVSVRTIRRWVAAGHIPAGGAPRARRIPLDKLLTFLSGALLLVLGLLCLACIVGLDAAQDAMMALGCPLR